MLSEQSATAETCCVAALVLIPVLIWWSGPSVSTEQVNTRVTLIVIVVVSIACLRIRRWHRCRKRQITQESPSHSVGDSDA